MSQHDDFDGSVARWFEFEASHAATTDVLDRALRMTRQHRPRPRLFATLGSRWIGDGAGASTGPVALGRTGIRTSLALLLLLLLVLAVVAGAVAVGTRLFQPAPVDLGIFGQVAGRMVYGDENGIWGMDPETPTDPATRVLLPAKAGIPLGWSSDGTRLLIKRGSGSDESLFVLHADGSELRVTEEPWSIAGATISPDGSRVVFAGATRGIEFALYAVDAEGGRAERLIGPGEDLIQQPAFSPDGTWIAYSIGGGDHSNSVWLIDADGTDAHPIVSNESNQWPGHVRGLAWSPAGDQIALGLGGRVYTFATDGSDLVQIAGGDTSCGPADPCAVQLPKSAESPYWSPDGTQIAYTTGCVEGAGAANREGCHLAVADADGSNVRAYGFPTSGPWHPGSRGAASTAHPTPSPTLSGAPADSFDIPKLTTTFVSPTNGFSVKYWDRRDGTIASATEPWDPASGAPYDDAFDAVETGLGAVFEGASTEIPEGVSIDDWIEASLASMVSTRSHTCSVVRFRGQRTEEVTIDGQPGRLSRVGSDGPTCTGLIVATVAVDGRLYVFILVHGQSDASARAFFDAFAATIELTPETVVAPSSAPSS